ncbi:hypothetical protein [Zoogloea sp.]|uniref:hypothetical protein n=1 Tax=Zoogloea sp. TaxID=49181 RepID=UPI001415E72A|nr:MAG: aldolase [Zoogloea sp.]
MTYGERFVLTLFTRDAALAAEADRAGVDRIGVDLERLDKDARQGGLATWISDHSEADLTALAARIPGRRLFARCNPMHAGSEAEIERLLASGVRTIMLPFFRRAAEVERFVGLVAGRAHPVPLLETAEAAADVEALCRIPGLSEVHVGLNDLRLSLGWPTHFHVLVSGLLERLAERILAAGHVLAIGGVGRARDDRLPIPSDLVLAQYPRLGAGGALVSRAFFAGQEVPELAREIPALRQRLDEYAGCSAAWLAARRRELARHVGAPEA